MWRTASRGTRPARSWPCAARRPRRRSRPPIRERLTAVTPLAPGDPTVTSHPRADSLNPKVEQCLRLHKCWAWFLVLGILIMVVGALAIGAAFITTFATIFVFGVLLLAG